MAEPSVLTPTETTVGDVCLEALKECGAFGLGQRPLAEDVNGALARLQWMLQQWERKSTLVYHLVTLSVVANGKGGPGSPFTVGPGGDLDTGAASSPWNPQFNKQFGGDPRATVRPAKLLSAFLRQLQNSQPNQIDYPLEVLETMNDYNRIALKSLVSFPGCVFLDASWPLAALYVYPVPNAAIYGVFITVAEQLPAYFPQGPATKIVLPYEYYMALMTNLAIRLRPKYGIAAPPPQQDDLKKNADDALATLRGANTLITRLEMPKELTRPGLYNIFNDRSY